jgi:hypothetical protein
MCYQKWIWMEIYIKLNILWITYKPSKYKYQYILVMFQSKPDLCLVLSSSHQELSVMIDLRFSCQWRFWWCSFWLSQCVWIGWQKPMLLWNIALKMEAACISEMLTSTNQSTQWHNPKEHHQFLICYNRYFYFYGYVTNIEWWHVHNSELH